jgi:hypothetical protein
MWVRPLVEPGLAEVALEKPVQVAQRAPEGSMQGWRLAVELAWL